MWVLIVGILLFILFSRPPTTHVNNSLSALVLYVVDGDTIEVSIDGKIDRVRLIGINAPEKYPKEIKECFADEASSAMKQLIDGQRVSLVADSTQDDRDVYGRLLRYIILTDGTNVNLEMVTHGFAREYTFKIPYQQQTVFRDAQQLAKSQNIGLWNACKKN